ncbi:MAG: DNA-binding response regulator [Clostridiales bacterium]|jgi:DNA-binding LytR/AlgR family response regulator|nr:DNA-binding response regulator [Clostridiales bacterium]
MLNLVLVDDERPALDELTYMLKAYDFINIIGAYTDPLVALNILHNNKVDAVFLDITMPEMDGFMLADFLMKLPSPPLIIFATAFDAFAIQAFEIHAVDYILKPLREDRLDRTIQRIEEQLKKQSDQMLPLKELMASTQNSKKYDKLPVWKNDRIYMINKTDILYCTCIGNDTLIVTKKEKYNVLETLSELELQLDEGTFFRCHRSYILRLDAINEIIPWFNNTYAVRFEDNDEYVPISRRNTKAFKSLIRLK